ncbi:MAG: tetratricopeptide repeat protein [Planctomycetaceae bacterium]|jgi:predicted Zn-dependent protease|nr:tetratricopeptide repeat protein [Planctomycetaceae bacterium]
MRRVFAVVFSSLFFSIPFGTGLVFMTGCQWGRVSVPLSPSRILSSERSRQGLVALEKGDVDEAEKRLSDAVRLDKNNPDHRRFYAEVLWKQGKQEAALRQLNELVSISGKEDAVLHLLLAEKYHEIHDQQTAFRHADTAVRLDAANARSWALRAKTRRLLTEAAWSAPQENSPEHTAEMFRQSRDDILRAITLDPGNKDLLPELALIQMRCGQFEQALAAWLDAQDKYPAGKEPVFILAGKSETLAALYRYDDAAVCLNSILQRDPNDAAAKQMLAHILTASKNRVQR